MLDALLANVRYVAGHLRRGRDSTSKLADQVAEFDDEADVPLNRCFYLSTAPEFFPVIVEQLGEHDLNTHDDADVRVVIEKPFGTTLQEAQELNENVLGVFREEQVFRIDHYLGKETVQNVLAFRFANGLFEPIWNRNYIDHVQITASEEHRHRQARGLLRQVGRAARPRAEPHAPAAVPALHGAAGALLRRRGARREGQGAARDRAPDARSRARTTTVRAQYSAGTVGGEEVPGLPRRGGRARRLAHRDLRRAAPGGRQLALGRRADLPAHRQAPDAQGHRDRRHAEARPPPRLRAGRLARRQAQPARADACSPTRARRCR